LSPYNRGHPYREILIGELPTPVWEATALLEKDLAEYRFGLNRALAAEQPENSLTRLIATILGFRA
jgi:hypothetical protein